MKKIILHPLYVILYTFTLLLLITSCDGNLGGTIPFMSSGDFNLVARDASFSEKYDFLTIKLDATSGMPPSVRLDDARNIRVKVKDEYRYLKPLKEIIQPRLVNIKYIAPGDLAWAGFDCLALVDLCQPSAVIQKQHDYIKSLRRIFAYRNLFIAFMLPEGKCTNVMTASDYVIDNYISVNSPLLPNPALMSPPVKGEDAPESGTQDMNDAVPATMQHAYLYRSVAQVLGQTLGRTGTTYDNSKHKILMVFSDGQVYNENNMPIDPQHFQLQETLIAASKRLQNNVRVYYTSLTRNSDASLIDNKIMRMLCSRSGGRYLGSFNWVDFQNYISHDFRYPLNDYEIKLQYQKGYMFLGNKRLVRLTFINNKTGKVIARCHKNYNAGTLLKPIIVGEISYVRIFVAIMFVIICLFFTAWVVMQLVIPYLRYRFFQNHYVHKYTGSNMSIEGNLVQDTCYYCKAPFRPGDDIVAKCQHTMHLECWEENGQHCPEHGKHCPEGSHYYNYHNLFDPLNGSFYIKWVFYSFCAIFVAWLLVFILDFKSLYRLLSDVAGGLVSIGDAPMSFSEVRQYASSSMYFMVEITIVLSFCITFAMAFVTSYHRIWYKRLWDVFLRAVAVQVFSFIIFFIEFCGIVACGLNDDIVPIDIITWTLMTYAIIRGATYHSRLKMDLRRLIIYGFLAGVYGAVCWGFLGMEGSLYDLFIGGICFTLYAVAIAAIIASPLPVRDHTLLHVNGEIKEMDIALYKWLRQSEDALVTIGRSVDCSLQISWDAKSDIAPVHAQICEYRGAVLLTSVEGSVFFHDKEIKQNQWVHLYHGDTFSIGTTLFTYIER